MSFGNPLSRSGRPLLALLAACVLWGTADVASKAALESIPPITLTALRFLVASLALWPVARRVEGPRVPVRDVLPLALIGVTAMFLLQNFGLARIAAANASLLQGATPALTLLVATALIGERLGIRRLTAVGLAALGMVVMNSGGGSGLGSVGLGDGLVLASMVTFALFVVLGKSVFGRYGTLPVVFMMSVIGSLSLLPAAAVELAVIRPSLPEPNVLLIVLYIGIGCSAISYALWGHAIGHLDVGCIAAFDALIPLTGLAAAIVLLGESVTRNQALGGVAIILGLIVIATGSIAEAIPGELDRVATALS